LCNPHREIARQVFLLTAFLPSVNGSGSAIRLAQTKVKKRLPTVCPRFTRRQVEITSRLQKTQRIFLDWLRVEYGIAKPSNKLLSVTVSFICKLRNVLPEDTFRRENFISVEPPFHSYPSGLIVSRRGREALLFLASRLINIPKSSRNWSRRRPR
jgi:hypothetical protein